MLISKSIRMRCPKSNGSVNKNYTRYLLNIDIGGEIVPWFRCIAERVMTDEWWDSIGNLDRIVELRDDLIHDISMSQICCRATGAGLNTSIMRLSH